MATAIVNKIKVTCGVTAGVDYIINLPFTDVAGIQAILDTIPSTSGTFTYFNDEQDGTFGVTPSDCVNGCKISLTVNGEEVELPNCCNYDEYVVNPSDLLSPLTTNLLKLDVNGKLILECADVAGCVTAPVVSTMVLNLDGTYTYTDEANSSTTIIPGDNVVANIDGSFTVNNPDGTSFIIPASTPDTDDQTASEVPITPIVASATTIAIPGTSTQDALGQIGVEIKTLQDQPQIFAKVGGAQTTNAISHVESEVAVRTGAVVIGSTAAPVTAITKLQVDNGDFDLDPTTAITGAITRAGVLWSHNFGIANTFLGINAGNRTTTGIQNVGIGVGALLSNTNGNYNSIVGYLSMRDNTTGFSNTSVGSLALRSNTIGNYNTALGGNSLFANISGIGNIAIGYLSMNSNTVGSYNVSIGYNGLFSNVSGQYNVANGFSTLRSNTIGDHNIASGFSAMFYNTKGSFNVSFGNLSSYYNTTSDRNTAIGDNSFNSYTVLSSSATITASTVTDVTISPALTGIWSVGDHVVIYQLSGGSGTISGFTQDVYEIINASTLRKVRAGNLGTTGTYGLVEVRSSLNISNSFAVGYDAQPSLSNQGVLGDTALTRVDTTATYYGAGFVTVSDERAKIDAVQFGSFEVNGKKYGKYRFKLTQCGLEKIGCIAQELEAGGDEMIMKYVITKGKGFDWNKTLSNFQDLAVNLGLDKPTFMCDIDTGLYKKTYAEKQISEQGLNCTYEDAKMKTTQYPSLIESNLSQIESLKENLSTVVILSTKDAKKLVLDKTAYISELDVLLTTDREVLSGVELVNLDAKIADLKDKISVLNTAILQNEAAIYSKTQLEATIAGLESSNISMKEVLLSLSTIDFEGEVLKSQWVAVDDFIQVDYTQLLMLAL